MYNLKKVWISLLLLPIPVSIFSIVLMFILKNGFETENFILVFSLYFLFSYYSLKEFVLNKFENNIPNYRELKHSHKFKILYKQTANYLFDKKMPFLSSKVLYLICEIIITIFCIIGIIYLFVTIFYSLPEYSFSKIIFALFTFLMCSFIFILFVKYLIYKPINMLFHLFIEPFCYLIKKDIDNDTTVYLKNDQNLYFYKNKKLHCDIFPAYIKIFNSSFNKFKNVDFEYLNGKPVNEFIDDNYMNCTEEEWFLNGEKVEIDTSLSLEKKRNIIKLMKISKDF